MGCPAARGAERAPCRDRTPWGKRDREGGAARLPASPSGSEPGEGRRPASRWSVEGCGLHVRRPSLRREAPGPDGRAGRLGGAAGLRAGAVQAGAWEGRRPRAAEGRPCTPARLRTALRTPSPRAACPSVAEEQQSQAPVWGAQRPWGGGAAPVGGAHGRPILPDLGLAGCLSPALGPGDPGQAPVRQWGALWGPRIEWSERLAST